ncbi:MAG: hypothetical protein Q7S01_02510 [bacterium]|nr:hypothetical protein [bacterium]
MVKKIFLFLVYGFAVFGILLTLIFFAVKFGLTNEGGIVDKQRNTFLAPDSVVEPSWTRGDEWAVLKEAIIRDQEPLNRAAESANISARLIVAQLVVEQLRLFHSNRELFKTVFAPLKVLGNQSQFSWGVMGIKQETARNIENNLKDKSSPFYLGPAFEHLLDFTTADPDQERFARLTDENDRYYSYLYASLYMKELLRQWQNAGFDISNRPEIMSTLYNIGFENSHPKPDPQSGGSEITIGEKTYSFGALAAEFYNSQELRQHFPN